MLTNLHRRCQRERLPAMRQRRQSVDCGGVDRRGVRRPCAWHGARWPQRHGMRSSAHSASPGRVVDAEPAAGARWSAAAVSPGSRRPGGRARPRRRLRLWFPRTRIPSPASIPMSLAYLLWHCTILLQNILAVSLETLDRCGLIGCPNSHHCDWIRQAVTNLDESRQQAVNPRRFDAALPQRIPDSFIHSLIP